jgi:photosystem II stability/assembly factor-like uncharacterized protein
MANVQSNDTLGAGYQLGATENLNGIACRYQGEAWVVGDAGTLLYTSDGGTSWSAQSVPTSANLRALATQDVGPVFVAGDGVFLTSTDTGAHWTSIATTAHFRSLAAAQGADTVLAISDDGGVFGFAGGTLTQLATIPNAKAVAVSPDGQTAVVAGNGLAISTDAGHTWKSVAVDAQLEDVNVDVFGDATAVGAAGAIVTLRSGVASVQHVGTSDLHTLHLADAEDADATGYAAGEGGQILITHDGGATWKLGPNVGRAVFGVDQIGAGHR